MAYFGWEKKTICVFNKRETVLLHALLMRSSFLYIINKGLHATDCVKKMEYLRACFKCIASCLNCGVMTYIETDKLQISVTASKIGSQNERLLLFLLLLLSLLLFVKVWIYLPINFLSVMLNTSILNFTSSKTPSWTKFLCFYGSFALLVCRLVCRWRRETSMFFPY